jgi:DNA repair exonuclease SbcCD ATPase subunit
MFILKSLKINNFLSFDTLEIDFSQHGFWAISGFNNKGGDSNGSGKSALLSSIVWGLFGKTQNGLFGKDVVRWGHDDCAVILTFSNGTNIYSISRTLKSVDFYINDQLQQGHKKDIQDLINKTFGTDYQLFLTFNIFTKAWGNFITEIGDAGRKKLFKSILMLDKIDNALNKAKEIYVQLNVQANKTEGIIKQLSNTLPELEDILNKNKELSANEERIKQEAIKELEQQKIQLKPEVIDFTASIVALDKEIKDLVDQKTSDTAEYNDIKLTNIKNLIFHDKATLVQIEEKLKNINLIGGECPTCGQKILAKNKKMHIRHLEILRDECIESLKNNETTEKNINKEIYEIDAIQQKISELNKRKSDIERQIWEQDIKIQKYNDFLQMSAKSLNYLRDNQTDYSELIKVTESKINKVKTGIEYNQNLLIGYAKEIDVFNYLQWLYGRQGVINLIIEKCFARLAYLSNRYLRKLSGEFKLEISAQKELKSGVYKDEVDIFVWNEGKRVQYASLSAGQQQRLNIAMLLALCDWGKEIGANSFDLLMLDEILDLSLAERGQEETLDLLYSKKPTINHIILISHKDLLKGQFDKEINILRGEDGISRIG